MGRLITINDKEVSAAMAEKKMSVTALAEAYGVSRSRMHTILNSKAITPICAGRLADALGINVDKLIM